MVLTSNVWAVLSKPGCVSAETIQLMCKQVGKTEDLLKPCMNTGPSGGVQKLSVRLVQETQRFSYFLPFYWVFAGDCGLIDKGYTPPAPIPQLRVPIVTQPFSTSLQPPQSLTPLPLVLPDATLAP